MLKMFQILKNKRIYIISPHQDDAVLSCGGLMAQLSGKADITVVNLFTNGNKGPYTLSAKRFLNMLKEPDAVRLFEKRKLEDKTVLTKLKAKIINLDLEDAMFRRKNVSVIGKIVPEFDHVYPTYRWHFSKGISKIDYALADVEERLKKIVKSDDIVLAPYGIGGHVDHMIARRVCEKNFKSVILYSDFPYNVRTSYFGTKGRNFDRFILKPDLSAKEKLVKMYETQFLGLFPDTTLPSHEEIYFIKKK